MYNLRRCSGASERDAELYTKGTIELNIIFDFDYEIYFLTKLTQNITVDL